MKRARSADGTLRGAGPRWEVRRSPASRSPGRRRLLLVGLLLAAGAVTGRAIQLQMVEGERWKARAAEQQRQRLALPAPRGTIYDRKGVPIAGTREAFRVAIAPREVSDPAEAAERLRAALGLNFVDARRAVDAARRWVVLPGRYDAGVRERLIGIRGVYFERTLERTYPMGDVASELLGPVSGDGRALGGIELEFDEWLAGRPGLAVVRRDAVGRPIPGAMMTVVEPVAGHDLVLTLDIDLQEIASDALRAAIRETGAAGGDLLFADPRTGEILAASSQQTDGLRRWSASTDSYEPGSTLKPFLIGALLAEGRATLEDSVHAEFGRYVQGRRTITDVTGYSWLTVRDALRFSSNIAVAKLSTRLDPGQQYRYLRDFGFGTPTRVQYPSESGGLLRRPSAWTRYSQGSLAMGYEIAVTPLQMTMAYGALANGGVLMEPRLVREIRTRTGETVRRMDTKPVRRVAPARVVLEVASVLAEAVETGTGQRAGLGVFRVAGKTGTARRFEAGRYESGSYTASFAGFFPAVDPQLVFLVKLDRPRGAYFGGRTAAPVTRAMLAAALAARHSPLDRREVALAAGLASPTAEGNGRNGAQSEGAQGPSAGGNGRAGEGGATAGSQADGSASSLHAAPPPPGTPYIFALSSGPPRRVADGQRRRRIPDVRGLPLREAAMRLHAAGFRVEVDGAGPVRGTEPVAGAAWPAGGVVVMRGREAGS